MLMNQQRPIYRGAGSMESARLMTELGLVVRDLKIAVGAYQRDILMVLCTLYNHEVNLKGFINREDLNCARQQGALCLSRVSCCVHRLATLVLRLRMVTRRSAVYNDYRQIKSLVDFVDGSFPFHHWNVILPRRV